jgi:uncharacterized SAM-binding protein YcdF (DUF218 family)
MNQKRARSCLSTTAILLAIILIVPPALLLGLFGLGRFLVVSDRPVKSDAVVVLSGGDIDRMDKAVELISDGFARYLILTDTSEVSASGKRMTDFLYSEATKRGITVPQIDITEPGVTNTREEAAAVRILMEERGWKSCIVVTDPYHSRRTSFLFNQAIRGSDLSVSVVPVSGHWYRPRSWFLSNEGWRVTLEEYIKLGAAWLGK